MVLVDIVFARVQLVTVGIGIAVHVRTNSISIGTTVLLWSHVHVLSILGTTIGGSNRCTILDTPVGGWYFVVFGRGIGPVWWGPV